MPGSTDPVRARLIASLARPGGDVTGNASLASELNAKGLAILKDAVPKLARVGFCGRRETNIGPPKESGSVELAGK